MNNYSFQCAIKRYNKTRWRSGLTRWIQAPVFIGGGSNPPCVTYLFCHERTLVKAGSTLRYLYAYFSSLKPIRSLFLHWTLDNFFLLLLNCSWNFRQSDFEKKSVSQIPCQTQYRSILLYCIRSHCTFLLNVIGSDVTMVYLFSQL